MATPLSGRISSGPHALLHEEVLAPQFAFEAEHLLPWYAAIEKVLAVEYRRMGLVTADQARRIGEALHGITAAALTADPEHNMSDIAFAIERHVESRLDSPVPAWHVDRSRNDLQACAQLMYARHQLELTGRALLDFGRAAHRTASRHAATPMPGYTHGQAAQIITAGYYLAALSDEVTDAVDRLLATYDDIDRCPLGAGAMAGQELEWDRDAAAGLLGFARSRAHALTAVASRGWALKITGELSLFGTVLSRFTTDLIAWGGSEYGFIDLPDAYAGISAAMPQKKNFPLLERIRGRTAHLTAFHLDALTGQRNTAYANSVEVSKEAGTHVLSAFLAARSTLALATAVLENVEFRTDRMAAACAREFFGGFTLANRLTLDEGLPWRTAQVVAGAYVLAALEEGAAPQDVRPDLLRRAAERHGHPLTAPEKALAEAFDLQGGVERKLSAGSTRPSEVRALLAAQADRMDEAAAAWDLRGKRVRDALAETDHLLGIG
ncbi:argininosuccinate lyase [Streptomyces sp. I05A-00742]|uniref:argininosuccinate lyase n=1 Tax=Streptomyces sp. I05A-00742 TaxID=2732853 RepID=UPI0014898A76|nr:lyase family protein [Streptomyces sp. I05A-00742]